ncbi:MAG: hypothetical protein ACNA8W_20825 [Bradymonadaceae bacterium]
MTGSWQRYVTLMLTALLFVACGDSDDPEDEQEPGASTAWWRLDFSMTEESIDLESLASVEVAGRPHPALAADYFVVARAGDVAVDSVPLAMARVALVEGHDAEGRPVRAVEELQDGWATAFVQALPEVDRIEVLGPGGEVVLTIGRERLEGAREDGQAGLRQQGLSALLGSEFGHIYLLTPGEERVLPSALYPDTKYVEHVVEPTTEMAEVIRQALRRVGPETIRAVQTIAIVEMREGGCTAVSSSCQDENAPISVVDSCRERGFEQLDEEGNALPTGRFDGAATGSTMILNVDGIDNWPSTIIHEAVHNLHFLLDATAGAAAHDALWPRDVVNSANQVIRKYRLGRGLSQGWNTIHESAIAAKMAGPYQDANWCALSSSDALAGGFMTPYGSSTISEDVAEYAAQIQLEDNPTLCALFASHGSGDFPREMSIQYVKLFMLKEIGAIDEDRFDSCVADVDIDDTRGIHLGDAISFSSELNAGYYESSNIPYFAVLGQGHGYGILIEAALSDAGESPVGLHRLDAIQAFTDTYGKNAVYLTHEDPFLARASGGGLLLIKEATPEQTHGAIFFLTLQNAFGNTTDAFTYSTFFIRH